MSKLNIKAPFKRANQLKVILRENGILVDFNETRFELPNHALQILQEFATFTTIESAMNRMGILDRERWMEVANCIRELCVAGILTDDVTDLYEPPHKSTSFASPRIHIKMLKDTVRTDAFIESLKRIVTPNDVVVDIGSGSGVLAIAAARAGAKKVYAVEALGMATIAQRAINRSGFADRIEVINAYSTDIDLPEKADILVSEIIGNHPFGENILRVFLDARARLLKPGARLLPDSLRVFALPVNLPASFLSHDQVIDNDLENWKHSYGIDFQDLKEAAEKARWLSDFNPVKVNDFEYSPKPILLCEINLNTFTSSEIDVTVESVITKPFNAISLFFVTALAGEQMTNSPLAEKRATSWLIPVKYFPKARTMQIGERFKLRYTFNRPSDTDIVFVD